MNKYRSGLFFRLLQRVALAAVLLIAPASRAAFIITEALPVNTLGKKDEDATVQPWIEIWNNDATSKFSLNGYILSHGGTQWTLPSVEIMPDERMVIFASAKNRTTPASWLHTNFTLSASGGTLTLLQPGGGTESTLTYPALAANVSFGRDYADNATGSYTSPTPGDENNYSGAGVSGKVLISPTSRAFSGSQSVTLAQVLPAAGAVIRYTLDGSVPVSSSDIYSSALSITATTQLRTRVFETGKLPGETESAGYLLLSGTTTDFNTAAPIVVVTNFGLGTIPDTGDQSVFIWVWEPSLIDGRARLTNAPTHAGRGVADRRGRSTLGNIKTNFNFEARKARDNSDNDIALLGMPSGSDWVFHAPYVYDRALLRNPFFYSLSNQIGRKAMRTKMAEVFVETSGGALDYSGTNSGDYFGVYNVVEKVRRGQERINVTKLDTYDNDTVGKTGGLIWKVDDRDPGDTGFSAGGQTYAYYYPKEIELKSPQRDPQEQALTSYINSFKTALDSASYQDPATGYAAWLDVAASLDHHLLNVWIFNVDAFRLSGYMHKERGGKMAHGPVWDADRTMSSTDGRDANPAVWRSTSGTDFFNFTWWNRIFTDPDFYQKYIDRWVELRRGAFSPTSINTLLDALNAEITAEAVTRDLSRWNQAKRAWTSPFTGDVYAASQDAEVQRIKDYLQQRADFFDSQWVAPVTFSNQGGSITSISLTMNGPAGATIYYTLDGSDPRPSGGAAPSGGNVFTYSSPITINSTKRVKARAYNANWTALTGAHNPPLVSTWSGLTDARFSTATPAAAGNLAITEINYHPTDPTVAELAVNPVFDASDFEFIELKNIGASTVEIGNIALTTGATYTLPYTQGVTLAPGAFAILAANPQAFSARYPGVQNVFGPFTGDLSNGGEQIVLKNAAGATISDFTYDDIWYPTTDGLGKTLINLDPTTSAASQSQPGNWRDSVNLGGSPGTNEPNPLAATPVFSPDGGEHIGPTINVTVTCATAGATIRYTTSGVDPGLTDPVVANGATVAVTMPATLKAKAWAPSMDFSAVKTASFTLATVATPVFGPTGGAFGGGNVVVNVTCATSNAVIRYTTNGSVPTEASPSIPSGSNITVPLPGTLTAIAWRTGMNPSAPRSVTYDAAITATGGNITTYTSGGTNYTAHTFTTNGTLGVNITGSITVEYLIIAGGGGGGFGIKSGGGGAGGFRTGTATVSTNSYAVIVGAGGVAGTPGNGNGDRGGNGVNSAFASFVSASGGGGGGSDVSFDASYQSFAIGRNGGSGGGAGFWDATAVAAGTGIAGQGFAGGAHTAGDTTVGGGGGGAGGIGRAGDATFNGLGGIGLASSISGTSFTYAVGGDGYKAGRASVAGSANTGDGGDWGAAGGSGIIIIRYVTPASTPQFATWANSNGIAGQSFTADNDGDGIVNGLEYSIVGLNPILFNSTPGAFVGRTISYTKRPEAAANADITYAIEVSDTLLSGSWIEVTPTVNNATTISYTAPAGTKLFARLKIRRY